MYCVLCNLRHALTSGFSVQNLHLGTSDKSDLVLYWFPAQYVAALKVLTAQVTPHLLLLTHIPHTATGPAVCSGRGSKEVNRFVCVFCMQSHEMAWRTARVCSTTLTSAFLRIHMGALRLLVTSSNSTAQVVETWSVVC
jgi:hypothetical protein